jgi:hypothetical protein
MGHTAMVRPTEQVAMFFARGPSPQEIASFRRSDEAVEHIRDLLYKNSAGTLTAEEERELDELMVLDKIVNLIRSHAPQSDE